MILQGDCLEETKKLPSESVDCVVTSPPYWALRDYGVPGQLGLEPTFQEYITKLCDIFYEVKRVLKPEGTCWVNLGDTYSGNKEGKTDKKVSDYLKQTTTRLHKKIGSIPNKSLCCIPDRFKIEMIDRGWICRNEIIWWKPNCMPSSVKDRFTVDYEKVFFFVKQQKYFFKTQYEPLAEVTLNDRRLGSGHISYNGKRNGQDDKFIENHFCNANPQGRNKRCVWKVMTKPFKEAHFATYPEKLIEPIIDAGCPVGGVVLDPFFGAGTTGVVAKKQKKNYIGIELNKDYIKIAETRINSQPHPLL